MSMVYNFEELVIWQLSRELVRRIYLLFRSNNDFGFRDQIQRAAVSIMNNISEGFHVKTLKCFYGGSCLGTEISRYGQNGKLRNKPSYKA